MTEPMRTTRPTSPSAPPGLPRRLRVAATRAARRADAIRRRAAALPDDLEPLRGAMRRRAAELDLQGVAFREIAEGLTRP